MDGHWDKDSWDVWNGDEWLRLQEAFRNKKQGRTARRSTQFRMKMEKEDHTTTENRMVEREKNATMITVWHYQLIDEVGKTTLGGVRRYPARMDRRRMFEKLADYCKVEIDASTIFQATAHRDDENHVFKMNFTLKIKELRTYDKSIPSRSC